VSESKTSKEHLHGFFGMLPRVMCIGLSMHVRPPDLQVSDSLRYPFLWTYGPTAANSGWANCIANLRYVENAADLVSLAALSENFVGLDMLLGFPETTNINIFYKFNIR